MKKNKRKKLHKNVIFLIFAKRNELANLSLFNSLFDVGDDCWEENFDKIGAEWFDGF